MLECIRACYVQFAKAMLPLSSVIKASLACSNKYKPKCEVE